MTTPIDTTRLSPNENGSHRTNDVILPDDYVLPSSTYPSSLPDYHSPPSPPRKRFQVDRTPVNPNSIARRSLFDGPITPPSTPEFNNGARHRILARISSDVRTRPYYPRSAKNEKNDNSEPASHSKKTIKKK